MLLIALSFLLTTLAIDDETIYYCFGEFYDAYCTECNSDHSACLKCADGYAFEEASGLCHAYDEYFQDDGQPVYYNNAFYNVTEDKVQMLDPFCVLNTNNNGTLCEFCGGFVDGLRAERYVSEDTTECHTTCSYGAQSRYFNGERCASCPTGCFQCGDLTSCQECSYTKKRISGTSTPANFMNKSMNGTIDVSTDCVEDRDETFTQDYYVSPGSATPASGGNTIWTDLNAVFYDIYKWVGNYKSAQINIYLLKSGTNLVHYLLDNSTDGDPGLNGGAAYNLWTGNPFFARVSERTQTEITISPRYCSDDATPREGCLEEGEKPVIKWKSEVTNIFVTKKVTISNIIMDGADMVLSLVSTATTEGSNAKACRDKKQECCTSPLYDEYGCAPSSIAYDDWSLASTQESTVAKRNYGIFVFQYVTDSPTLYIPELIIENCEIKNFLYSKYHTSFVEFDIYGGQLTIINSSFDRFFFPHGLISNSHDLVDRNYDPMTSSFTQITCRKIDPSYQGDCYSILLQNSSFTNYNPLKTTIETEVYKNRIEGAVLTLHNFDGPITVYNCTFQNMLSFSPLGPIDSQLGVCDEFDFYGSEAFASVYQASHDIIATSKYKLFFDKHFRKYYEAPDNQNLPTTAVLHLRNVTKGLLIHENTFEQIHSVAGGSIFVHGFNNTYETPIVITSNNFTNNFAQLFALNVLIYKERQDIASMECTGLLISNNEFSNNYGCYQTLGNVALACEVSITDSSEAFSTTTYDSYYKGYSSDVNQDYDEDTYSNMFLAFYLENVTQALNSPRLYTHPLNSSMQFDLNFVEISDNLVYKNYAILSNGFYVETVMNLLVENNVIKQNSIVTSDTYSDPDFALNVLTINGITPTPRPVDSTTMLESSPLVIRYSNRINILNNIFDGNSQGFWGGDYHIAQAISLSHLIAQADVVIQGCQFNNHVGLPSTVTGQGFYSTAQTAMITFGYWTSLTASASALYGNNFSVIGCNFTGNQFGHDPYADTKLIYYNEDYQELGGSYEYPFAHLLKFVFEDEETAINITTVTGKTVSLDRPTNNPNYFTDLSVIVQDNYVTQNNFGGPICAFNNFFFMKMEITDTRFISNTLEEDEDNPSALVCALESSMYSAWFFYPEFILTGINFTNTQGQEVLAKAFYDTITDIEVYVAEVFRLRINGMTSTGNIASVIAPIFITMSKYISITGLVSQSFTSNYGLAYVNGSTRVLFSETQVSDTYANITGIFYIVSCSDVGVQVDASNNALNTTDLTAETDNSDAAADPAYYRALVTIEQSDTIVFNYSNFHDSEVSSIFIVTSSSDLSVQGTEIQSCHIIRALSWAVLSSTIAFDRCQFSTIDFDFSALAGIAALDSATFSLTNSNITTMTGAADLILSANLSTATLESTSVKDCIIYYSTDQIGLSTSGLITTKLGALTMDQVDFVNNTAETQTLIYALLLSTFTVSDSTFDSNSAQDHQVFDLKKLMTQAVFTGCTFIDIVNTLTFDVSNEDQVDSITVTSTFINVFDTNLYVDTCKFIGGLSTNGAINLLAETKSTTITNSQFHNNVGPVGSIGGLASLSISSTLFYGNTYSIYMTSGTTATFNQVQFQEERTLSVILQNFDSVTFNQVTFNGQPDNSLRLANTVYSPGPHSNRGAQIQSSKQITIVSSRFLNMRSGSGNCGGGIQIYNPQATVALQSSFSIQNSYFYNTSTYNGAGICILDYDKNILAAEIVDTVITHCFADQFGGGVFYHSYDDGLSTDYLRIRGTTQIMDTIAGAGGGAIYYESKRPQAISVFLNGSSPYGPIWGSYPITVKVIANPDPSLWANLKETEVYVDQSTARILKDAKNSFNSNRRTLDVDSDLDGALQLNSGAVADPPPVLGLIDVDGQVVTTWNAGTIELSFNNDSVIKETSTTFQATNGYFVMYPLKLLYTPGQYVTATLDTDVKITSGSQVTDIPINLVTQALFRNCQRGERETDSSECIPCVSGQYILSPDAQGTCQVCPQNLNCSGGDDIAPVPGYWRFDGWKTTAIQCLTPSSCLGQTPYKNPKQAVSCKEQRNSSFCLTGFCNTGYEGNLCASCSNGYAKSGNSCASCSNNPLVYIVLVVVVIIAIFFIVFTVRNALKIKEASKVNRPKTSILIKIFLNYVQLVSIVASFQFQWPDQIKTMFEIQDKVASGPSEAFSLDCLLPDQTATNRSFFIKLLLISISPLVLLIVGSIVWSIIFVARKAKFDKCFKSNLTTTFVVLVFMLHATLVQYSILAFRCQNIGDDDAQEIYLERDLEVKCWESLHLTWVFACALPAFLIWGIGTPIFAYFLLRRNLKKLENIEFKSKYGFLYDGYKKKKYYWEFVILYRKILMIFISVFMVTIGIKIQALCVLGVCFLSYLLQIYGVPFEDQNLNDMERRSLINATVTLYCGIYYVTGEMPVVADWILLVIILGLNVYFFVVWFKLLIQEFLKERKAAKAQSEREKLEKREKAKAVKDSEETNRLAIGSPKGLSDVGSPTSAILKIPSKKVLKKRNFLKHFWTEKVVKTTKKLSKKVKNIYSKIAKKKPQ